MKKIVKLWRIKFSFVVVFRVECWMSNGIRFSFCVLLKRRRGDQTEKKLKLLKGSLLCVAAAAWSSWRWSTTLEIKVLRGCSRQLQPWSCRMCAKMDEGGDGSSSQNSAISNDPRASFFLISTVSTAQTRQMLSKEQKNNEKFNNFVPRRPSPPPNKLNISCALASSYRWNERNYFKKILPRLDPTSSVCHSLIHSIFFFRLSSNVLWCWCYRAHSTHSFIVFFPFVLVAEFWLWKSQKVSEDFRLIQHNTQQPKSQVNPAWISNVWKIHEKSHHPTLDRNTEFDILNKY